MVPGVVDVDEGSQDVSSEEQENNGNRLPSTANHKAASLLGASHKCKPGKRHGHLHASNARFNYGCRALVLDDYKLRVHDTDKHGKILQLKEMSTMKFAKLWAGRLACNEVDLKRNICRWKAKKATLDESIAYFASQKRDTVSAGQGVIYLSPIL